MGTLGESAGTLFSGRQNGRRMTVAASADWDTAGSSAASGLALNRVARAGGTLRTSREELLTARRFLLAVMPRRREPLNNGDAKTPNGEFHLLTGFRAENTAGRDVYRPGGRAAPMIDELWGFGKVSFHESPENTSPI